jgi:hypothetical protein
LGKRPIARPSRPHPRDDRSLANCRPNPLRHPNRRYGSYGPR